MKIPHDIAVFLHFGWTACVTMTLFCLGGNYLDRKLGTFPVIFLTAGIFGVLVTTGLFIISVRKADAKKHDKSR